MSESAKEFCYAASNIMTNSPGKSVDTDSMDVVYAYHDRTKHQPQRYARAPGYMDWANQPDPFRYYDQASLFSLDQPSITDSPGYDSLFKTGQGSVVPINPQSISHLFFESLAISAWKQAGGNRWSLRVNPSSGNLHPTEAYLIAGPIRGLSDVAAVWHYCVYRHALERRLVLTSEEWTAISQYLPSASVLVALASIHWRESWKYGERAFRYCQHDAGHAVAAVSIAAALLNWDTRLVGTVTDDELAMLLGIHQQQGHEAEHPDCLLVISAAAGDSLRDDPVIKLSTPPLGRLKTGKFDGHPNTLSSTHHEWPIIEAVAQACRYDGNPVPGHNHESRGEAVPAAELTEDRQIPARRIIRERRSAVAMDGHSHIDGEIFYRMMMHITPCPDNKIIKVLPWRAKISVVVFLHRVHGLSPGLYLLVRDPFHEPSLRKTLRPEFRWARPADCPESLPLYQLLETDVRDTARMICCHQDIASDGAFALAMLAEFDASLEQYGASFYPRLFWETGLIGQILYLEAEAAAIRATGIGCFFDDVMHEVLGIHDHAWQSLYHFTVGKPVDDPRLQTLPPYGHLQGFIED